MTSKMPPIKVNALGKAAAIGRAMIRLSNIADARLSMDSSRWTA